MKNVWLIFFSILASFTLQAVPEESFFESFHQDVLPYFAKGSQRVFINPQGMKLNFYSFTSSQNSKNLVILPGRTEPGFKYAELVYDLRNLGFNIYLLDHQGQGFSERILSDSNKGHIRYFTDYTRDFSEWMKEIVVPETQNQKRYLFAHSMGGAVASLYLTQGNKNFTRAVLSSPMMEINTKPYSEGIGRLLTKVLVLAGQGKKYAPDRGPYIAENDTLEVNEVTHSEARFNMSKALFVTWPEIALGGPTARWVYQSLKATKHIDHLA